MKGSVGLAVAFATFGAFVGEVGGLTVLLVYWYKRKGHLQRQIEENKVNHQLPLSSMDK